MDEMHVNSEGIIYTLRASAAFWNVSFPEDDMVSPCYRGRKVGLVYDGHFWDPDSMREINRVDAKFARKYLEEMGFMRVRRISQAST